jgi:F0F1-type ATP synthase membrane subunit c/vacuolar-type H+-ATPase subunit K
LQKVSLHKRLAFFAFVPVLALVGFVVSLMLASNVQHSPGGFGLTSKLF